MAYETIIGLEIHVQLKTKSKMFCTCDNRACRQAGAGEDAPPNTTVCPICMGHPGVLPVANRQAVEWAALTALALKCSVAEHAKFDRKHYFYPDLPKGYQISQFDEPIGREGNVTVTVDGKERMIGIERLHLEEDAAKLLHEKAGDSGVDFNRAGTPLMEIVTKPDLRSPAEARKLLQELRLVMRYLGVSDADMEKGHLRCDANVSLRPLGEQKLYPKMEIKNLNSFRNVERALQYEIERQKKLWEASSVLPVGLNASGTLSFNVERGVTVEQRRKETSEDYRYVPEPDLPPLRFTKEWTDRIRASFPELPRQRRERLRTTYRLDPAMTATLVDDRAAADFFEAVMSRLQAWFLGRGEHEGTEAEAWAKERTKFGKLAGNWLTSKLYETMNERRVSFDGLKTTADQFAELIGMIAERRVNSTTANAVLKEMVTTGRGPNEIVEAGGLAQVGDETELSAVVEGVIAKNEKIVADYRKGKVQSIQVLVGQVMKVTKGRADPGVARKILEERLQAS